MSHFRLFVEKKPEFNTPARDLLRDLQESIALPGLTGLRVIQRYDVTGVSEEVFETAARTVLSEPIVDVVSSGLSLTNNEQAFAVAYLPGQFDQRADSAAQCIQILSQGAAPDVHSARVIIVQGNISPDELEQIKQFSINAVDSHEVPVFDAVERAEVTVPDDVEILDGFTDLDAAGLTAFVKSRGLAMTLADLKHTQAYFRDEEGRNPSITEIRMLDTYWSDHCRHTTFATAITDVTFDADSAVVERAYGEYLKTRDEVYGADTERPVTLMDIALMGMKQLRKTGELDNVEVSEEINAASIEVDVDIVGQDAPERWLVMFKNETHNHPTEIEPFGGAATCLGGCIRDPLSGRSYVYQAMRVTGAADPRTPFEDTLPGKLPQRKICRGAADGYSSYGNQIGLATGCVAEVYHPNYVAKRMEIGAVVAAAPKKNVFRGSPATGDVIMLIGGRTGRDGVGGATGSSKEHTDTALDNSAEVQKGNPPTERKIQRLFRDPELAPKIKVCNDFGAGGVSVAIGELADSLDIDLDQVLKKYDGLDGTELAISESQERMAIVIDPADVPYFEKKVDAENLECSLVAKVTESGRLTISWRGQKIVNLTRKFIDTNGVTPDSSVAVSHDSSQNSPLGLSSVCESQSLANRFVETLSHLNTASQKGLGEMFDASIGAGTVLWPFGGAAQLTPTDAMVAKIPVLNVAEASSLTAEQTCDSPLSPNGSGTIDTTTTTHMSWGFDPDIAQWSPFHGALYAVSTSVCRIISSGARLSDIRLTLQEYFEKLGTDPERWGKPFAALLGAFKVQDALRLGAIGGKDSMSGSFNDIDVPPTLVSFALAPGQIENATSPEFKAAGEKVYFIGIDRDSDQIPDFDQLRKVSDQLHTGIANGKITAAHTLGRGGLAEGLAKMAFGNRIGATISTDLDLFRERHVCFLVTASSGCDIDGAVEIGQTIVAAELQIFENGTTETLALADLEKAWREPLESTYPTQQEPAHTEVETISHNAGSPLRKTAGAKTAIPRVLIPTFPGTNCEYDTAKAFKGAGGDPLIQVFRNQTADAVEESLVAFAREIANSQILMLPGGFSAGDEPDGSGKFIATVLRNPRVADAVMDLIRNRDGLVLGICNGFQALVKTGLLPYGEISEPSQIEANGATLTFNDIGRHISTYQNTRISSDLSPWLANTNVGDVYNVPFSHGEGKFYAEKAVIERLIVNGQIATQYCSANGSASMAIEDNPNGSLYAIEGITSPDGRVFGKMGHSERRGDQLAKNLPGNKHQPLFKAGIGYFA